MISAASFAGYGISSNVSPRSASLRVGLVFCPTASQPRRPAPRINLLRGITYSAD